MLNGDCSLCHHGYDAEKKYLFYQQDVTVEPCFSCHNLKEKKQDPIGQYYKGKKSKPSKSF